MVVLHRGPHSVWCQGRGGCNRARPPRFVLRRRPVRGQGLRRRREPEEGRAARRARGDPTDRPALAGGRAGDSPHLQCTPTERCLSPSPLNGGSSLWVDGALCGVPPIGDSVPSDLPGLCRVLPNSSAVASSGRRTGPLQSEDPCGLFTFGRDRPAPRPPRELEVTRPTVRSRPWRGPNGPSPARGCHREGASDGPPARRTRLPAGRRVLRPKSHRVDLQTGRAWLRWAHRARSGRRFLVTAVATRPEARAAFASDRRTQARKP
jgi:hypothetical protein